MTLPALAVFLFAWPKRPATPPVPLDAEGLPLWELNPAEQRVRRDERRKEHHFRATIWM